MPNRTILNRSLSTKPQVAACLSYARILRPGIPRSGMRVAFLAIAVSVLAGMFNAKTSIAGEITLKNGTVLKGKPTPMQGITFSTAQQNAGGPTTIYQVWMIDSGVKRYFVPRRQVEPESIISGGNLLAADDFTLPQKISGRKLMLRSIGTYTEVTPFSEFGRRRVTVSTSKGPVHIVQGITKLTPEYVVLTGLTHRWEQGLATTSIPTNTLIEILHKATDTSNPDDRLAIIRFLVDAQLYKPAQLELQTVANDFPDLKSRIQELAIEIRQLQALQVLNEIKRRRDAGQHRLAYASLSRFPTRDVNASVQDEVKSLIQDYNTALENAARVRSLLGSLQVEVNDEELRKKLAGLRSAVIDSLSFETLTRLKPFLQIANDAGFSPEEKLSLAYSGWVVGSANATEDVRKTLALWQARFKMIEYLRTINTGRRKLLIEEITGTEGIGPQAVDQLLDYLPMQVETPDAQPGVPLAIETRSVADDMAVNYHVLLPTEYDPQRQYPVIVCLHEVGRSPERELAWWGGTAEKPGQSQRHGYIVIAPEYTLSDSSKYDYSAVAHQKILESLTDARKRFNIDSDRVFLAGHGMGGDAVFDLAMSHPDVFAGAIPITGISDNFCRFYWQNAPDLPWYVVGGEFDRDALEQNARELNKMFKYGHDVIYAEFKERGRETYYEEIHEIFRWMDGKRRQRYRKEFEVKTLRESDNEFYWVALAGLPDNVTQPVSWADERVRGVRPMEIEARVTPGNTVYVSAGANSVTVMLSPDFVDYEKRVRIRVNGRQRFRDFLEQDIGTMLEHVRMGGDRQRRVWTKMSF